MVSTKNLETMVLVRNINLTQCRLSVKQTNTVAALAAAQTTMGQTNQLVHQIQVLTDIVSEQRDDIVGNAIATVCFIP